MTEKRLPSLPRGRGTAIQLASTTTSSWFDPKRVEEETAENGEFAYEQGRVWLGRTATEAAAPVGWMDDKHMVTIAGSRSGKGVSAIIPALCEYPGSVLCIDPKGQNAFRTAARRGFGTSGVKGMMQRVYVLDPYRVSGVEDAYLATFDPLDGLSVDGENTLEEAGLIADALVVSTNSKDAHFDDSARTFIEALILHVVSYSAYEGERTLGKVRVLLRDGDHAAKERALAEIKSDDNIPNASKAKLGETITAFEALLETMSRNESFEGVIAGAASGLLDLGDRERGSVLSTARRNLKFLDAPKIRNCMRESEHHLRLQDLNRPDDPASIYLVLPSRLMKTHSRWLRLFLNMMVSRLETDGPPARTQLPMLAILDEFPTLGHLSVIENAVGYMAEFGLKIWSILQDLSQLKRDYPDSWETFLGNAGMIQCFGNSDQTTLNYISKRMGEIEVLRETTNSSETTTEGKSDLSDYEKVSRTSGKPFGAFDLENDTRTESESKSNVTATSRTIVNAPLLTADEVRRFAARSTEMQIVLLADYLPLYLRRSLYYADSFFDGKYLEVNYPLMKSSA